MVFIKKRRFGNGKGIGTFVKDEISAEHVQDVVEPTLQITKLIIGGVDSISVYRSSNHSIREVSEALDSIIDIRRPTIITGDFNKADIQMPVIIGLNFLLKPATGVVSNFCPLVGRTPPVSSQLLVAKRFGNTDVKVMPFRYYQHGHGLLEIPLV